MVKKSNGKRAKFNPDKIKSSLRRAGANSRLQEQILKEVEKELHPGITTKEIYQVVSEQLKKRKPGLGARYHLRSALLRLGPAGYNFERYVASVLKAYSYKTELPNELQGACVTHEVDVIAEKDNRRMFIEAKFRNQFDDVVDIKDTMATWARYLDLVDGAKLNLVPHFDEAWIVTNARFTSHSLKFGHCKNMMLIGWNHPEERSLARMVDINALYPLTVLEEISDQEIQAFADQNLILCRELVEAKLPSLAKKTKIRKARLEELQELAQQVIES